MTIDLDELRAAVVADDRPRAVKLLAGQDEASRRSAAPTILGWSKERALREHRTQAIALLATATPSQMRAAPVFHRPQFVEEADAVAVLRGRPRGFLDSLADQLCEDQHWRHVRAMLEAGLCGPRPGDGYVLGLISTALLPGHGFGRSLRYRLLADPRFLESDFWRIFEVEGDGETSLANFDKYMAKGRGTWLATLVELCREGHLDRNRLLDASLAALSRGFIQYRASWHSAFHEALEPTPAERVARVDSYLRLLGSDVPPTVSMAIAAVREADAQSPIPGKKLLPPLEALVLARTKATQVAALALLDAIARREKKLAPECARVAARALVADAADVQSRALAVVQAHGDPSEPRLAQELGVAVRGISARLRPKLTEWMKGDAAKAPAEPPKPSPPERREPSPAKQPESSPPKRREVAPDPATSPPPATLADLIDAASALVEAPDPLELERVLDGLMRLCDQRPADFARRTGPLRQRCEKLLAGNSARWDQPIVQRVLCTALVAWIDGAREIELPRERRCSKTDVAWFVAERLATIVAEIAKGRSLPLIAAPTSVSGFLEPTVFVDRVTTWQRAKAEPDVREAVLALLRLSPVGRAAALRRAKSLDGEIGAAARFALGGDEKVGKTAALWIAAGRSRQPTGDIAALMPRHAKAGPDAAVAATIEWTTSVDRWKDESLAGRASSFTNLEMALVTTPAMPEERDALALPVLFHDLPSLKKRDIDVSSEDPCAVAWAATAWPGNLEGFLATGALRLKQSVNWASVDDRATLRYVAPLRSAHVPLGPMARLCLALALAAEGIDVRLPAREALEAAIEDGRFDPAALGADMRRLLESGDSALARWTKSLADVARASETHAGAVALLLQHVLQGDPEKAPREVARFLDLLDELLAQTGTSVETEECRDYLTALAAKGRTAKLVKQVLARAK